MAKKTTKPVTAEEAQDDPRAVEKRLAEPFHSEDVKWKVGSQVKDGRVLMLPYVDARAVMERLDEVFGVAGWQTGVVFLPSGDVVCTLKAKFGDEWVQKSDVGSQSDQPDAGDRAKAAVSDSLKRAAVHFGIGRYLYGMGSFWADWDFDKKTIKALPRIPKRFLCLAEREKAMDDEGPKPSSQPGPGLNGQEVPPVKLGDANGNGHVAKPTAAEPDQPDGVARFFILYRNLSPDEQKLSKQVADAICAQSGPQGSKKTLLKYRTAMHSHNPPYPSPVLGYLDAYLEHCWKDTPGPEKLPEAELASQAAAPVQDLL